MAYHPAVLRLIARAVTAAHSAGIPVDVCGEAAGDPETLPLLVGLGVDELSVSPARLAHDAADDPRPHALARARRDRRGAVGDELPRRSRASRAPRSTTCSG